LEGVGAVLRRRLGRGVVGLESGREGRVVLVVATVADSGGETGLEGVESVRDGRVVLVVATVASGGDEIGVVTGWMSGYGGALVVDGGKLGSSGANHRK
jgi:hypothetical protein